MGGSESANRYGGRTQEEFNRDERAKLYDTSGFSEYLLNQYAQRAGVTAEDMRVLRSLRVKKGADLSDPASFEFDPAKFGGTAPAGKPTALVKGFLDYAGKKKQSDEDRKYFLEEMENFPGRSQQIVANRPGKRPGGSGKMNTNNVVQSILARQDDPVESVLGGR